MYTIKQGDTLYAIAKSLNTTVAAIEAANPGIQPSNLQIGASIKIPAGSGGGLQTHQPVSQATQYTIQQGDTFYVIASRVGIPIEAIESSNPGVDPSKLQVGQVINVPQNAGPVPGPSVTVIPNPGGNYVSYSGSSSNFPHPQHWAPYHALWHHNSALMRHRNTSQQIAHIGRAIEIASSESGIDPRIILCLIMQESGGHVAVPDTFNPFRNTGVMQAFDGANFDAKDEAGSILQMIRDGTSGTAKGPGLRQNLEKWNGDIYVALRGYNSGSVNLENLNDPMGATPDYVQKIANRLMGHTWPGM